VLSFSDVLPELLVVFHGVGGTGIEGSNLEG